MKEKHIDNSQTSEEEILLEVFRAEVLAIAKVIGIEPKEIRFRQMRTKWASCSSRGRITFNTELLYMPADFRREVIAHELLHLKIPNHGKLFKVLLKSIISRDNLKDLLPKE